MLALVKMCEQPLQNTRWMISCNNVLVVVASRFANSNVHASFWRAAMLCQHFFMNTEVALEKCPLYFKIQHRIEVARWASAVIRRSV